MGVRMNAHEVIRGGSMVMERREWRNIKNYLTIRLKTNTPWYFGFINPEYSRNLTKPYWIGKFNADTLEYESFTNRDIYVWVKNRLAKSILTEIHKLDNSISPTIFQSVDNVSESILKHIEKLKREGMPKHKKSNGSVGNLSYISRNILPSHFRSAYYAEVKNELIFRRGSIVNKQKMSDEDKSNALVLLHEYNLVAFEKKDPSVKKVLTYKEFKELLEEGGENND